MSKRTSVREIEEQAALYALGALGPDEAGKFQKRLSAGCDLCRSAFDECRTVAEALPLAAPDIAPRLELRHRLMERIGTPVKRKAPVGKLVRPGDTPWASPIPGVDIRPLLGKKTMLVRMAPGTVLPEHEHHFGEQCLVLEGSIRSDDMEAHAGDFTFMPAGTTHSALYTETGCLLLITYT
jgi:mannose-6-phosphate isomerase-like protein (cupin superfamily)